MVLYNKQGEITKVYPVGSDPHRRYWLVMDILDEVVRKRADRISKAREEKNQKIDNQIEECDKEVFRKAAKRSRKRYNLTQAAQILGVHRQTLYYWIKKGWIKPKRDYRRHPVFTVLDIESMIEWRNAIKFSAVLKIAKTDSTV